jgi:rfaE bifunctional protein nucleotidyltransferase chain/domain
VRISKRNIERKIINCASALADFCEKARAQNLKISATTGTFDILHDGHAKYLIKASELADILIVGIDCDRLVKSIKGEDRPYWEENVRAYNIAAHEHVDAVLVINSSSELIEIVKPEYFVMSETTRIVGNRDDEVMLIKKIGGKIIVFGSMSENSTTAVLGRMRHGR